jgi:hypothetical protein
MYVHKMIVVSSIMIFVAQLLGEKAYQNQNQIKILHIVRRAEKLQYTLKYPAF